MAEIKPDKILADLEKKLAAAKTDAERAAIQEEITARQNEIVYSVNTPGFGVGFGARGMYVPSKAEIGTTILEPTLEPGVFTKTEITGNPRDLYGRAELGNKVTLYDAEGKPLSAADAAKTEVGLNFAASGRDIGYGPGFIAPGVRPDIEFATFNNVRADMPNAAAAAGVVGGPAGFRTSSSSTTDSTTASTTASTSSTATLQAQADRKSAYDLLYQQFAKYGLQALVTPLESLIKEGVPASEFAIRLRETDAYQKRFAANKARINKGLAALSEAEYIGLEDQYQNIMRQYGMPESYYARGEMGKQEGFEKLIAGDVSAAELESRVSSAYNRVINANPEVVQSLKSYYPNITNGDILSYVLDPEKALTDINKKITAAEIGGAALGAGLAIGATRAEELGAFGVTKAQAQQGYQTIAEFLPTEMKLSNIYRRQGLGPYTQSTAEAEVFGLTGAAEAAMKRKKFGELETAQFSGQAGVGALGRERAGQF